MWRDIIPYGLVAVMAVVMAWMALRTPQTAVQENDDFESPFTMKPLHNRLKIVNMSVEQIKDFLEHEVLTMKKMRTYLRTVPTMTVLTLQHKDPTRMESMMAIAVYKENTTRCAINYKIFRELCVFLPASSNFVNTIQVTKDVVYVFNPCISAITSNVANVSEIRQIADPHSREPRNPAREIKLRYKSPYINSHGDLELSDWNEPQSALIGWAVQSYIHEVNPECNPYVRECCYQN